MAWIWHCLWLRSKPAAVALMGPLAWEPPYVAGVALKQTNKQTKKIVCVLKTIADGSSEPINRPLYVSVIDKEALMVLNSKVRDKINFDSQ